MDLTKYEPQGLWDPFSDLRNEMERVIDNFWGRPQRWTASSHWHPPVDIEEENDKYLVRADLPGVNQDNIKISMTGNTLTIHGERKSKHKEKHEGYCCYERACGDFYRSFQLPSEVNPDKIKAKHKNGVLEIEIPKSEKAKPREISVKVD